MKTPLRSAAAAVGLFAAAVMMAGCVTPPQRAVPAEPAPASTPTQGPTSTPSQEPTPPSVSEFELDAAWLDSGRMVAVVTHGSSSCVPFAEDISAEGQTVSVTLNEGDPNQPCTADLAPRASLVPLPAGVDPTQDVELIVTRGELTDTTDLDGNPALTGVPSDPTGYESTAGWFDDSSLVLLTWGSSSCQPIVESVETSGNTGTITFVTEDRMCTMDMAPRLTLVHFDELDDDAKDDFTLTLVGDNLDNELTVIEG